MSVEKPEYDLYEELELPLTASPEAIRTAYRKLSKKHAVDVALAKQKRLNEAAYWLLDGERKVDYDKHRRAGQSARSRGTAGSPSRDRGEKAREQADAAAQAERDRKAREQADAAAQAERDRKARERLRLAAWGLIAVALVVVAASALRGAAPIPLMAADDGDTPAPTRIAARTPAAADSAAPTPQRTAELAPRPDIFVPRGILEQVPEGYICAGDSVVDGELRYDSQEETGMYVVTTATVEFENDFGDVICVANTPGNEEDIRRQVGAGGRRVDRIVVPSSDHQ